MTAIAKMMLTTRAQVVSAHGGVFEQNNCSSRPALVKWSGAPVDGSIQDPLVDAYLQRTVGTIMAAKKVVAINDALRLQRWHSYDNRTVVSTLFPTVEAALHNELVAQHMAAELERLYAGSFCFRPLWERKTWRCHLEASFMLPRVR